MHGFNHSAVRARFRTRCKKAVNQASLNQEDILPLDVPLPTLPDQKRIAGILENVERLRAQQREAERQAEHLFQTLLHRAFSSGL